MAKAWKDVIASPQYQALAPEQKAQAQEQYFNEVVAPQAGENAEQAKQAFYAAYPLSSVQPVETQQPVAQQQPQQSRFMSDLGEAVKETGRGLVQAGVNVANIPASIADAVTSAAAWAGGKLGIGDGTYQPAPRVTTQGLEQDFGLQQGALTPQTTEGRVFAEALPYLTPAGVERAATQAPTLAGRIAQGATRLLAENAVGTLAANSAKDDAEALATDLGVGVLAGGAINAAGRGLGAAYRGVRGAIAPEAQQAIRFAEREGVPLHTTDLLQPTSRVGKMAQTTAENIPLAGTSGMRATQQEARSQLGRDLLINSVSMIQRLLLTALKRKHQEFVVLLGTVLSRFRMQWRESTFSLREQFSRLILRYLICRSLVRLLITRRFQNFNHIVMSLFAMLVLMVR